jgi:hypothetical protein
MNIAFLDFWQYPKPFDPNNNFLTNMLRMSTDINIVNPNHAELIIYSCFGNENKRYSHCKKIFYTGECIRPDFNQCDYSISFDFDSYDNRNIRIPLWYFYIDWFSMKTYGNPDYLIPIDYLTGENEFTKKEKSKFCSAVFSQSRDIRFDFVNRLKSYKDVDCYGKIHKNSLPDGERYKMDIISDYKFNMCFENTIFPGYFTEKLLHAKIAGCVPLYYSDKSYSTDFNSKCCINLIEFENQDTFIEYIKEIDSDYSLYQKIAKEPLFKSIPDLSDLVKSLSKIIEI